jgi:hypothetical protein
MQEKLIYGIVLQVVCGRMFRQNHYKVRCLEICERSFRTVREIMMTTSSGNKMSQCTNQRRNKLQLFLHCRSVLEQSNYAGQTE